MLVDLKQKNCKIDTLHEKGSGIDLVDIGYWCSDRVLQQGTIDWKRQLN